MNIDFTTFNYDTAVTASIATASANPTDIIIVGAIFLCLATIRVAYVNFINETRSSIVKENIIISEEEITSLRESVEQYTNNLNSGDSKLIEVCWEWIVNNDYIPNIEEIISILMQLNV
jgi:hypothetical protein